VNPSAPKEAALLMASRAPLSVAMPGKANLVLFVRGVEDRERVAVRDLTTLPLIS